jgi:signal transduction histidine kinase
MPRFHIKALFGLLEKWRWLILALIGLLMLAVEIQEFRVLKVLNEGFHFLEVVLYGVLLISTGLLIEFFARSSRAHKQAANILAHKHRLSVELTNNVDSESLWEKLAEIPSGIVDVIDCYLLLGDSLTGEYPVSVHWVNPKRSAPSGMWDPAVLCPECLRESRPPLHLCRNEGDPATFTAYKLEFSSPEHRSAFLKFRVSPENKLSVGEKEIFSSIRDEIRMAVQIKQDRRKFAESRSAEAAVAEQRSISRFVHDLLGQNLGFLHLRLDHLAEHEAIKKHRKIHSEIGQLREVAGKSYDIVRDILKAIRPAATPHLTSLLQEYGGVVSRRAGMKFTFESMGNPLSLDPAAQQTIFFAFREMVSNVEKHAHATRLEVVVEWNDGLLKVSVTDNGRGFEPDSLPEQDHYGFQILQERAAALGGTMAVSSRPDSGTIALLSVPLAMISVVPA